MTTNAEHQRAHRKRRAEERTRLIEGYNQILAKLKGNDKPLAVELRAIAETALGGGA